jgi:type 1 glutamine amidotransferase
VPVLRRVLRVIGWLLLVAAVVIAIGAWRNWDTVQRVFLGGVKVYETVPPKLPADLPRPAILVFSKTNAFRHEEAIPAAAQMFEALAKEKGWGVFQTENGAAFTPEILARFDVVVFSNTSGDVFTPEQRAAFKAFVESGGGYLGIHAAGDNSHEAWEWYVEQVIGTRFIGHPMSPQFQSATVRIENRENPVMQGFGPVWQHTDEWYSFDKPPRQDGITVLATLDESTYNPGSFFGTSLAMGKDHPVIWTRCVGQGRAIYAAPGHTAATYAEPVYRQFIVGALGWLLAKDANGCAVPATGAAKP